MKCNHCGAEIPDDSKFCGVCGKTPQAAAELFCPACGTKVAEEQRFCVKCGAELAQPDARTVQNRPAASAVPAGNVTRPPVAEAALQPAGVVLRCCDGIIDVILLYIIGYIIALFTGQTTGDGFDLRGAAAFVWWIIGFIYYVIFEAKLGATPGKMVLGLKVVKTDGEACDIKAAIIRTICRIVDNFLIVGVLIIAFSKRNQRLGDRLADTLVIKTKAIKLSQIKNNQFTNFDD